MATKKKRTSVRNIGQEILNGINDIKAGRIGRVVIIPGPVRPEADADQIEEPARTRFGGTKR